LEGGTYMEITDVRLKKFNTGSKMKAIASITFDNEFVVHEIKVIESQKGTIIAMPSKGKNGKFNDIAHPINSETREKITKAIMEAYDKAEDPEPEMKTESTEAE
jgi:stage V sporulation protein G